MTELPAAGASADGWRRGWCHLACTDHPWSALTTRLMPSDHPRPRRRNDDHPRTANRTERDVWVAAEIMATERDSAATASTYGFPPTSPRCP